MTYFGASNKLFGTPNFLFRYLDFLNHILILINKESFLKLEYFNLPQLPPISPLPLFETYWI